LKNDNHVGNDEMERIGMNCNLCKNKIEMVGNWAGGHNAEPVTTGRCCGICNETKVIPARIEELREFDKK